jgi:TonB family protein
MPGNPDIPMKTILQRIPLLIFLAVAVQALAAFESAKLSPDNLMPQFPASLITAGVTEGHVTFAVSIGADGKLNDSLPLSYTHLGFVTMCRMVMKDWEITPARLDGQNVPVQMELRFDFKREGVVETNTINISNHYLELMMPDIFTRQYAYRMALSKELDHAPVAVTTVNPVYAKEAEKDGVSGKVQVYFYIDEKGEVRFPSVTADAHPYLSDIAVTALRQWHFQPPTRHGEPVMIAASQEFDFGSGNK